MINWEKVKVGDVIKANSGVLRTVRDISEKHVTFSILHCSWTHRPYTVYGKSEIRKKFTATKAKHNPNQTRIERQLQKEIADITGKSYLDCCDVKDNIR